MTWSQNYDPFGNWRSLDPGCRCPCSHAVLRSGGSQGARLGGRVLRDGRRDPLANLVFGMPATMVVAAAGHGWIFGMLRIGWIIIASIFLYNIAVETGQFQVMKDSIAGLSGDKRLQLILIAFCFGAFLEGTGGGGAPVAITGAFLIGLGFNPFQAAVLCLVANTAPVAWGGIGNPIRTLAGVTGLPEMQFSAMTGRILPPLAFILPLWLVRSMVGLEANVRGVAGALRERLLLRPHAVLLVEPPGGRSGRHRVGDFLAARDGRVAEVLAPGHHHAGQRATCPSALVTTIWPRCSKAGLRSSSPRC